MADRPVPPALAAFPRVAQWISFDEAGVVEVRTGKVEIGQGILTALAQIAADELDVSPSQVRLSSGDSRSSPDEGFTAGSHSIETSGLCIRLAASAARRIFFLAAAAQAQVEVEQVSVAEGRFFAAGIPLALDYWALGHAADLSQRIEDFARPKAPQDLRLVGRELARIDLPAKLGGGAFIHDLDVPHMLHGRVVHAPSPSARLEGLDETGLPAGARIVREGGFIGVLAEREEVVTAAAMRLAATARWGVSPGGDLDPEDAVASTNAPRERGHEAGTPPSRTDLRHFEAVYARPFLAHASIGPACAIAHWSDDRLKIWTHSQGVMPLRAALARTFGLEAEKVEVRHAPGAGCYGHNGADDVALDAAILARAAPGRPVRVVWSRADEMTVAPFGAAMFSALSADVDPSGRVNAFAVDIRSPPHLARPGWCGGVNLLSARYVAPDMPRPEIADLPLKWGGGADRNAIPIYDFGHVTVDKRTAVTPVRTSALRTLGGYLNVFATEMFVDEIAEALELDPVAFRLAHLSDERARAVLERVADLAPSGGEREPGVGLGLGLARYADHGAYCAVIAEVEVDERPRVRNVWAVVDAGLSINPDGVRNQIEGGVIQSISWTLNEKVAFQGAVAASRTWEDYPILRFPDAPRVQVEIIQRMDEPPLGVGEAAQGPAAAAVGNAIARALGVRIRDLPITRERLVTALA
jgi:nicotinate dehydrogenase subunit B